MATASTRRTARKARRQSVSSGAPDGKEVSLPGRLWRSLRGGNRILLSLLLFVPAIVVFLPARKGEFIEYDESLFITGNAFTKAGLCWSSIKWSCTNFTSCNWHPLTWWSHMLDYQLYGDKTAGHHMTNLLLHGLNMVLIFLVLKEMTGWTWRSFAVAALFGLHPLRVESVAWISERKDVLCAMFFLLSIWSYVKFARSRMLHVRLATMNAAESTDTAAPTPGLSSLPVTSHPAWWYGLALVFFALGLVSKPMVVTLPCVLFLLDFWPLERWKTEKWMRLLLEKIPFFLLTAAACVVTIVAQHSGGSLSELPPMTIGQRLANAVVSYARYLGKTFWPADLCALYPHPLTWPTATVVFAGLLLLGISGVALTLWRRRPFILVGWLWYLGTLVPVIQLVQEGPASMADRYSYIPSIGVFVCVVWILAELKMPRLFRTLFLGGAVVTALVAGSLLIRKQIPYWHDDVAVWSRCVAVTKDSFAAHHRLGRAFSSRNRIEDAIPQFEASIQMRPDYNQAEARYFLATALSQKERWADALYQYDQALLVPNANKALANHGRGAVLIRMQRFDEAIDALETTLKIDPNFVVVHLNLGCALMQKGRVDEGMAHLNLALKMEPNLGLARLNLAIAHFRRNEPDKAESELRQFVKMEPQSPQGHFMLGYSLGVRGDLDGAMNEFNEALRLNPNYTEARTNLGRVLQLKAQAAQAQPPAAPEPAPVPQPVPEQ